MGTFTQRVTLHSRSGNGAATQSLALDALVDTGAMFSAFPARELERLGVKPFRNLPIRFANGTVEQWPMGEIDIEIDGQRMPILVLFGSSDAPPLLGAHALEAFLLMVDPVEKKLIPREAYLMTSPSD